MKKILFQGDSITDAGRDYQNDQIRGYGYATLVSAQLAYERPNEFQFINKGISGNRIIDLLARVRCDMINLEPDYLSILIGTNDVWHEYPWKNGVDAERFEVYYDMLLSQIQETSPKTKIMIMGPFVLNGSAMEGIWDEFRAELEKREAAAKRIAEKYGLVYVSLMDKFDKAAEKAPVDYWTWEGVHPTEAGHEIIKRAWLDGFAKLENA